jgi:hypothetical protein
LVILPKRCGHSLRAPPAFAVASALAASFWADVFSFVMMISFSLIFTWLTVQPLRICEEAAVRSAYFPFCFLVEVSGLFPVIF